MSRWSWVAALGVLVGADVVAGLGVVAVGGPVWVLDPSRPWLIVALRAALFLGAVVALGAVPSAAAIAGAALLAHGHPAGVTVARVAAALHLGVPVLGWAAAGVMFTTRPSR